MGKSHASCDSALRANDNFSLYRIQNQSVKPPEGKTYPNVFHRVNANFTICSIKLSLALDKFPVVFLRHVFQYLYIYSVTCKYLYSTRVHDALIIRTQTVAIKGFVESCVPLVIWVRIYILRVRDALVVRSFFNAKAVKWTPKASLQ